MSRRSWARATWMKSLRLTGGAAIATAMLAAACGGGSTEDGTGDSSSGQPAPAETGSADSDSQTPAPAETESDDPAETAAPLQVSADVPDLELIDVATGSEVQLRSLFPSDTPVLLWFWAPH